MNVRKKNKSRLELIDRNGCHHPVIPLTLWQLLVLRQLIDRGEEQGEELLVCEILKVLAPNLPAQLVAKLRRQRFEKIARLVVYLAEIKNPISAIGDIYYRFFTLSSV